MSENFDYRSLRVLPYALLAAFVIIPIVALAVVSMTVSSFSADLHDNLINDLIGALLSNGLFINYIALIVALICLYRLNDSIKWFNLAWAYLVIELLAKLVSQISTWFYDMRPHSLLTGVFASILYPLPDIAFIFAVAYLLKGVCSMYDTMGIKESESTKSLSNFFITIQIARVTFMTILYIVVFAYRYMGYTRVKELPSALLAIFLVSIIAAAALLVYHAVIGFMVYSSINNACQEYYLHKYNAER